MNLDDYQYAATLTASDQFHKDGVDPITVVELLSSVARSCAPLDQYKRALFYADRTKYALGEEGKFPLSEKNDIDILHALLGIVTETGEMIEAYLAGKDPTNLLEETGDQLWYLALMARGLGVPLSEVGERNIAKLKARFPDKKFTRDDAIVRDLAAEDKALRS